jgi:hypothetical protein
MARAIGLLLTLLQLGPIVVLLVSYLAKYKRGNRDAQLYRRELEDASPRHLSINRSTEEIPNEFDQDA